MGVLKHSHEYCDLNTSFQSFFYIKYVHQITDKIKKNTFKLCFQVRFCKKT